MNLLVEKYCKYCQGLCPAVRKSIREKTERNIYKHDECKRIIRQRVEQLIKHVGGAE